MKSIVIDSDTLRKIVEIAEKESPAIFKILKPISEEHDLEYFADIESNQPVLVGYTNIKMGYNNYKPIEPGTPVYEFEGKYFVEQQLLTKDESVKVIFSKESLSPCINFI